MRDDPAKLRAEDAFEVADDHGGWRTLYWTVQGISAVGFVVGFLWIVLAFMSQHQGNLADHETVVGGLAWDIGVMPVTIATIVTTLVLLPLGWKALGWRGIAFVLLIQASLAFGLYVALIVTAGLWY